MGNLQKIRDFLLQSMEFFVLFTTLLFFIPITKA